MDNPQPSRSGVRLRPTPHVGPWKSHEQLIAAMDYMYVRYFTSRLKDEALILKQLELGYKPAPFHEPYVGDIGPASLAHSDITLTILPAPSTISTFPPLKSIPEAEEGKQEDDDDKTITGDDEDTVEYYVYRKSQVFEKTFSNLTLNLNTPTPSTPSELDLTSPPRYQSTPINSPQPSVVNKVNSTLNISNVTKEKIPKDATPGYFRILRLMLHQGHVNKGGGAKMLPIARFEKDILQSLERNQFIIIEGCTGSGKSTQVPQFILDFCEFSQQRCSIAVTQPRRIAAVSLARRVSNERGWQLGAVCGYHVGLEKSNKTDTTRITYMTTGVLLRQLISRKSLRDYTHIIIDEAHERDVEIDLLLACIRKILVVTRNSDTRIIIMSATIDSSKFANYFFDFSNRPPTPNSDKIIQIGVKHYFQVREFYLDDIQRVYGSDLADSVFENTQFDISTPVFNESFIVSFSHVLEYLEKFEASELPKDFFEQVFDDCESVIAPSEESRIDPESKPPQSIRGLLIFLPGISEITEFHTKLTKIAIQEDKEWLIIRLHSSIPNEEQQRIFEPIPETTRKIILATNIAESSITVPDVGYVVDFCLTKTNICDSSTKYSCLKLDWTSKQQTIQRRGRVGRTSNGICIRMIPRYFYNKLTTETIPDIKKTSLDKTVLDAKLLGLGPPQEILGLTLDPPTLTGVRNAVKNLKEIGALTITRGGVYKEYDGDITSLGLIMSKLPIDVKLARLIVLGHIFGVLEESIVIAACLSVGTPFALNLGDRFAVYLNKLQWGQDTFSDNISALNLYRTFLIKLLEFNGDKDRVKEWCHFYMADWSVLMWVNLYNLPLEEVEQAWRKLSPWRWKF